MRFFRKDADLGERTEGKGYLMTNPKQAYADSKVTNWQFLEKDVWRMTVCLASTTTASLWIGQRSLQTSSMMEKEGGRRKLPRPCNFNFNAKTWCSKFSNYPYYLNTAQISSLPHSIFLPLKLFLHIYAFDNHFWYMHPICMEYDSQSVHRAHSATCALSLNLQKSFLLWKSQILFIPSKWENVPDTRWWSPWETIM